jgi:hypothetical protein
VVKVSELLCRVNEHYGLVLELELQCKYYICNILAYSSLSFTQLGRNENHYVNSSYKIYSSYIRFACGLCTIDKGIAGC